MKPATSAIPTASVPLNDVGGPRIQFLAAPQVSASAQQGMLRGTILPGGFVPLHSHVDLESFLLLEGDLSIYIDDGNLSPGDADASGWITVDVGDLVVIPPAAKHAWRNTGKTPAVCFIITTGRLYSFFTAVAEPVSPDEPSHPPSPQWLQKFLSVSAEYGYWNGSPEDNAKIGLTIS